jgi:methyl-accepting chemotaxis protein
MKRLFNVKNKLIVAFTLILLLPSISLGWFSYHTAENKLSDGLLTAAKQSTDHLNAQINDLIVDIQSEMDYMGAHITNELIQGIESPRIREQLDAYKTQQYGFEFVYLATAEGLMLRSPELQKKLPKDDPRTQAWYAEAMLNPDEAIHTEPYTSSTSGNTVVTIAKKLIDGSGVVGVDINLQAFSQIVSKAKIGQDGYVYILDKSSHFLIHPKQKTGTEAIGEHYKTFYTQDSGIVAYNLKGVDKQAYYTTSPITGWKIVGTMEMIEVYKASSGVLYATLIVISISLVLGALIVFLIIRSITVPLKSLTQATLKISQGNLTEEIPIYSHDEIGQVSNEVNHMSHNLRSLIGGILSSSQSVADASQQIFASTDEMLMAVSQSS